MRMIFLVGSWALLGAAGAFTACDSSVNAVPEGETCEDFLDTSGGVPVAVTVRNDTGGDIWLVEDLTCSLPPLFRLTDDAGAEVRQPFQGCTCDALQSEGAACGFTCDGPSEQLVYIPAGASHQWQWTGEMRVARTMPQACYGDTLNSYESCDQVVPAAAGTHTFAVDVFTGLSNCEQGGGGSGCTCTPGGGMGSCTIQTFGYASAGKSVSQVSFEVPGDTAIIIVAN